MINDLKIIAIKPCDGCHKDVLKVLKKGRIYYLYNDYTINEKTESIIYVSTIPKKLFDTDKMTINISAIAGQNGSGKSTLIELLFMAINNIAFNRGLNVDLELVKECSVELYCLIGDYYKIKVVNEHFYVYKYNDDNTAYSEVPNFDLSDFFYTIAINYSLYAYNSTELRDEQEDWLHGLFHKNDSYQTPLVINPMREKGNINVNTENYLGKVRLIANMLKPSKALGYNFRKLTDNLVAVKLQLTLNKEKSKRVLYEITDPGSKLKRKLKKRLSDLSKIEKNEILKKINDKFSFNYEGGKSIREKEATDYLIGKLISIAVTYEKFIIGNYYSIDEENFNMELIDDYIHLILAEDSHITFKVKQTLNFLKYPYLPYGPNTFNFEDLSKKINKIIHNEKGIKPKIEEFVPPPIFNIDILMAPLADSEKESEFKNLIEFKTLSSGEKQVIYSINSVLYHLINIDSVKLHNLGVKYKFVNIILEEVELYFHPEMQRCFLKNLLDGIRSLRLDNIKGINMCFVTHSPFILSDIPDANVLFLEIVDKVSQLANRKEKTFGANIHDLLADGFFMYNGFCGAFAAQKITETINFLEYHQKSNRFKLKYGNLDMDFQNKVGMENDDKELKELYKTFTEKKKGEHLKLIKAIGESVLSVKLFEMYDETFKSSRKAMIRSEIARLKKQLNDLD